MRLEACYPNKYPNAIRNRYTVVVCAKGVCVGATNYRKGFLSRPDAQDFAIEEARKLGIVAYVYDQTLRATVYRVDCTQTQATGREFVLNK